MTAAKQQFVSDGMTAVVPVSNVWTECVPLPPAQFTQLRIS